MIPLVFIEFALISGMLLLLGYIIKAEFRDLHRRLDELE
jgi:hypothetical protein